MPFRRRHGKADDDAPRIDLALGLLALLGIAIVVFVTFDLWSSHP